MSFLHLDDLRLGDGDALLVVDVQNDFLSGGALAVPGADQILPLLDRAMDRFASHALPIFASRCWHPPDHCSFRAQGGRWPPHCVQDSTGAELAPGLALRSVHIVSKATTPERDAYSAFDGTDLEDRLHAAASHHLFVGGVATEHCVLNSVTDALERGFCVSLLVDAIRAIDPRAGAHAIDEMRALGAVCIATGSHRPEIHVR